jgi:hypothetical protein
MVRDTTNVSASARTSQKAAKRVETSEKPGVGWSGVRLRGRSRKRVAEPEKVADRREVGWSGVKVRGGTVDFVSRSARVIG